MMARGRWDNSTLDLLAWEPPVPSVGYDAAEVRGATLAARVCRAMALALSECGKERDQVAQEMGEYLGQTVTRTMLDAWVSEAKEDHNISFLRYAALVHATGDMRLLSIMPELFGFVAIERRFENYILAAMAKEKAEELQRTADAALRRAKGARP